MRGNHLLSTCYVPDPPVMRCTLQYDAMGEILLFLTLLVRTEVQEIKEVAVSLGSQSHSLPYSAFSGSV